MALLSFVESMDITSLQYTIFLLPSRAILNAIIDPCFSSAFLSVVPEKDWGSALGCFSALVAGMEVLAALYGGWSMAYFGMQMNNAVSAIVLLAIATYAYVVFFNGAGGRNLEADGKSSEHKAKGAMR